MSIWVASMRPLATVSPGGSGAGFMYHQPRPATAAAIIATASTIHLMPGRRDGASSLRSGCGFSVGPDSPCPGAVNRAILAVFMVLALAYPEEIYLNAAVALSLDADQPVARFISKHPFDHD